MSTAADDLATRLYAAHGRSLRRYADRLVGDPDRGEDLVQETLLRAWQYADRLVDDEAARRGWLFRVVHNMAVDDLRARRARPTEVPVDVEAAVGDGTDQVLTAIEVNRALRELRPEHRAVLVEIFYRGRTTDEAARALRIPHGTAKSRLFYGLRHLRRRLAGARSGTPSGNRSGPLSPC